MRSIGIPVANREECVVALEVAFRVGKSLGADVMGYHMRPTRRDDDRIDLSTLLASSSTPWPEMDEKSAQDAAVSAQKLFSEMAAQNGYELANKRGEPGRPVAVYRETVGVPDKLIPIFGPTNDMLVVSRPRKGGGVKAWTILMSALLDSPVPVLVLPQKPVKIQCRRLALAWDRGRAETLLAHLTLPLLRAAEDVVLLSAGKDHKHGPSERDMVEYLKSQGIEARSRQVVSPSSAVESGKALVRAAQEEKADALMSGAYTRGRLRQMIFGGVTEYLVTGTDFPVILLHSRD